MRSYSAAHVSRCGDGLSRVRTRVTATTSRKFLFPHIFPRSSMGSPFTPRRIKFRAFLATSSDVSAWLLGCLHPERGGGARTFLHPSLLLGVDEKSVRSSVSLSSTESSQVLRGYTLRRHTLSFFSWVTKPKTRCFASRNRSATLITKPQVGPLPRKSWLDGASRPKKTCQPNPFMYRILSPY